MTIQTKSAITALGIVSLGAVSTASADTEETPTLDKNTIRNLLADSEQPLKLEEMVTSNNEVVKPYEITEPKNDISVNENGALEVAQGESEKTSSDISGVSPVTNSDETSETASANENKLFTVKYLDEANKEIKASHTATHSQAVKGEMIEGYDYITNRVDESKLTVDHIYMKHQNRGSEVSAPVNTETSKSEEPSTNTEQTERTNVNNDAQGLTPETTAVFVTTSSAKTKTYYYMEETARKNNPDGADIIRTNEKNAESQGYKWVGAQAEPNPKKTTVPSTNGNTTTDSASTGELPHTGDSGSAGILGGLISLLGFGLLARRRKDV